MESYIVQKAQQCVEALARDGSREQRLAEASIHVSTINREIYIDSAPQVVADCIKEVCQLDPKEEMDQLALALKSFIQHVFEEAGRRDN